MHYGNVILCSGSPLVDFKLKHMNADGDIQPEGEQSAMRHTLCVHSTSKWMAKSTAA